MRSPPIRRLAGVLLSALVAGAMSCGCGGDDEPAASEPPTTTAPSTAPPSTLTPEEEDEQALRRLAEEWFEAVRQILSRRLPTEEAETYIAGDYLRKFRQQVGELQTSGRVVILDPQRRSSQLTREVSLEGNRAVLIECIVDGDHLLAADGQLLNDEVTARLVRTEAERTAGGWRFTARSGLTEEGGSSTCSDVS